jgi:hypothetical protein
VNENDEQMGDELGESAIPPKKAVIDQRDITFYTCNDGDVPP